MTIKYNTYKYPGKFDKTVHIVSGENEDIIHVIGNVSPIPMGKMEVSPRKTVINGLQKNKTSLVGVNIKNIGDAPMVVSRITSRKTKVTYWEGSQKIPAGKTLTIDIAVTPSKEGRFMDIIMVHSDARNDIGKGYKAVVIGVVK